MVSSILTQLKLNIINSLLALDRGRLRFMKSEGF
jgi:hypothetical protein